MAILVARGFEQVELTNPRRALDENGATTLVVSPERSEVRGWNMTEWGDSVPVDVPLRAARAEDFDALLLPGGVMNPDQLRANPAAVSLVRNFFEAGKPIAAICHGPWVLAEAGIVAGLRMTSYPSIKTDLRNAGAQWVDQEVVVDRGIVTSRGPDDLPAFNRMLVEAFSAGVHRRSQAAAAG